MEQSRLFISIGITFGLLLFYGLMFFISVPLGFGALFITLIAIGVTLLIYNCLDYLNIC